MKVCFSGYEPSVQICGDHASCLRYARCQLLYECLRKRSWAWHRGSNTHCRRSKDFKSSLPLLTCSASLCCVAAIQQQKDIDIGMLEILLNTKPINCGTTAALSVGICQSDASTVSGILTLPIQIFSPLLQKSHHSGHRDHRSE